MKNKYTVRKTVISVLCAVLSVFLLTACSGNKQGMNAGEGMKNTVNSNDGHADGGLGNADNGNSSNGALGNAAKDLADNVTGMLPENDGNVGGNTTANY